MAYLLRDPSSPDASRAGGGPALTPPASVPSPSANPQRGLLDLRVTLSQPRPEAGSEFTVYVIITNVFDVPVWLESPQVFLPSEIQVVMPEGTSVNSSPVFQALTEMASKGEIRPRPEIANSKSGRWKYFSKRPDTEVAEAIRYIAIQSAESDRELMGSLLAQGKLQDAINQRTNDLEQETLDKPDDALAKLNNDAKLSKLNQDFREGVNKVSHLRQRLNTLRQQLTALTGTSAILSDEDITVSNFRIPGQLFIQARGKVTVDSPAPLVAFDGSLAPGQALQPGNTAVFTLTLKTRRELLFRPLLYVLQYSIVFYFDKQRSHAHTNTISQSLTIAAPFRSVMIGAAIGGLLGAITRMVQSHDPNGTYSFLSWKDLPIRAVSEYLPALILSTASVIFMARKSEVRSIVSVEDFWGGVVIGFLVGYTGKTVLDDSVKNPTAL